MKHFLSIAAASLVALGAAAPAAAQTYSLSGSGSAYLRSGSDLFAGPGYDYPRVEYVPAGRSLRLHGCLSDYAWCDVSSGYARGWVDADDLVVYRGSQSYGLYESRSWYSYTTVTFIFGSYWNNYYRNRPWYNDRYRYQNWDWRGNSHRWNDRNHNGRPNWRDNDRNNDGRPDWNRNDRDGRGDGRDRDNDRNNDWRNRDNDRDGRPSGRDDNRNNEGRPNWNGNNGRPNGGVAPVRTPTTTPTQRPNWNGNSGRPNGGAAPVRTPDSTPIQRPNPQRFDRPNNAPERRADPVQTRPSQPAVKPQAQPQRERPAQSNERRGERNRQQQEQ